MGVEQNLPPHLPSTQTSPGISGATQTIVQTPRLFRVLLLNDDFTPMDFVISILENCFRKSSTDAEKIMLEVHTRGAGLAGIFTLEIAEMKVMQVHQLARAKEHPLKCVLEPESSGSSEGGHSAQS